MRPRGIDDLSFTCRLHGEAGPFDIHSRLVSNDGMTLVLGVDSSTQSTTALLVDADDGTVVERQTAPHPPGTSVDPRAWLTAYDTAAGPLLARARAVSIAGQQHGLVALDEAGQPVRDALLWNDTRSAAAAADLIHELGGPAACAEILGSVLVASFTSTKLRWLRDHEPDAARQVARVLLPHDWVALHACGGGVEPWTDRGDASGTGYFSTADLDWRPDLLEHALGHGADLPRLIAPGAIAAERDGVCHAAGTGDNMAAALGLDLQPGVVAVSLGTSGVASTVTASRPADPRGLVTGFADARGGFLPMATTLNAARILDLQAALLGVDHGELAALALAAAPGAGGVTISPYYAGERTPNLPSATGTWAGLRAETTRADLARAAVEALLCALGDAIDAVTAFSGQPTSSILLTGGAAANPAVQRLAPAILGHPVTLPPDHDHVALGAARQAAWALAGTPEPPAWPRPASPVISSEPTPLVREAYALLRDRVTPWS